jgi:hypothetical protein
MARTYTRIHPHERFWAQVERTDGCWNWTGYVEPKGYGRFSPMSGRDPNKRSFQAHRYAYEMVIGPIPEGLEIDHLCRNRRCIRPEHLEAVTHLENLERGETRVARKFDTHCQRGHPFSGDNLGRQPSGRRYCKTCYNAARRRRRKALMAAVVVVLLMLPGVAHAHHRPGPCDLHWWKAWSTRHDTEPIKDLIRCAAARWPVVGGASKALAVAGCESGFRPDAYGNGNAGVFQHRLPYWPGRYDRFTYPSWHLFSSVYNGRTNVIVSIRMVHAGGWGPWEGGICA